MWGVRERWKMGGRDSVMDGVMERVLLQGRRCGF